jgi:hypothetical protein
MAIGGTPGGGLETTPPPAKEQPAPPVIPREEQTKPVPPVVPREEQPAPPVIARNERPAPPVIAREEQPQAAPAPPVQRPRQKVAVENTWLTRMRAELVACGKAGLWRNDICREVTRWKYCHPNRWHTVAECAVESFR